MRVRCHWNCQILVLKIFWKTNLENAEELMKSLTPERLVNACFVDSVGWPKTKCEMTNLVGYSLKFRHFEKITRIWKKKSHSFWRYLIALIILGIFLQNFVAFLEHLNFKSCNLRRKEARLPFLFLNYKKKPLQFVNSIAGWSIAIFRISSMMPVAPRISSK